MATRYVWGKYNKVSNNSLTILTDPIEYEDSEGNSMSECHPYPTGDASFVTMHPDYYNNAESALDIGNDGGTIYYGTSAALTGNTSSVNGYTLYEAKLTNPTTIALPTYYTSKSFTVKSGNYFCLNSDTFWVISKSYAQDYCDYELSGSSDDYDYTTLYQVVLEEYYDSSLEENRWKPRVIMAKYATTDYTWKFTSSSYGYGGSINTTGSEGLRSPIFDNSVSQGSLIGYVSSTSSYTYPSDGVSGSYWYKYITSDNIADPTAISLVSSPLIAGSYANYSITSSATAGSYGTITYYIGFKYDDAADEVYALMTATTSKTGQVMLPSYATKNIKLRVYVTDGIGYTSSVHVYSPWYNITSYTIYTGVGGAVRGVSPVVCVGGAVKTSVTTKKGVNGVVKS